MSVSTIGIQIVTPQTETNSHTPPPQPQAANDNGAGDAAKPATPPPSGMGKYVDKMV